jgi:hypothetical protein
MSFLEEFGGLKTAVSVTAKDVLLEGIKNQRTILKEDYDITNSKSKAVWFKEDGKFVPYVGMYRLFGKKFLSYEKGMESYVLDRLEESINSGDKDIMKLLADVDAKRAIPRQRRTPNAAV